MVGRVASSTRRTKKSRVSADESSDFDLSSSDRVVEHICSSILAGRYVPGQRLVEADLTHKLRVSRGPVREAFRRLDALGILARSMHRGASIRTLDRTEALDLLVATEPVSLLAARLAAERFATRPKGFDAGRFEKELRPYRDRQEDAANLLRQRHFFYEILVEASGNSQLASMTSTMRVHLLRAQIQSFLDASNRREHLDDYSAVAKAVLAGDAKAAEKVLAMHLRRVREILLELPDVVFPRP